MNPQDAEKLAVSLMKEHRIWGRGWRFKYDKAIRRFGVCNFRTETIGLSLKLVEVNDEEKVKDVILHEIAHAIAGHSAGHGEIWKRVCLKIGAKPERCYSLADTNTVKLKYHATCDACGKEFERSRIKYKERRRSCPCQGGKSWDNRVLLEYKERY